MPESFDGEAQALSKVLYASPWQSSFALNMF